MFRIHAILVPTDFSEESRQAFRLAAILAQAQEARLVVVHVSQPLAADASALQQPLDYEERLHHALCQFRVAEAPRLAEHQLVRGEAVQEILRVAKEAGCDLIVMGTHGRTGTDQRLMGSVAEQVLRKASCPVVTVKAPHPTHPAPSCCTAGAATS
jgi:nucleotide-binding universal stress UspA family protein